MIKGGGQLMTPGGDQMPRNAKWTGNIHTHSKETFPPLYVYIFVRLIVLSVWAVLLQHQLLSCA